MTERDWLIRHAEQLRWEAANLRAMRLWLIEQQDLVAAANRIEAVAADLITKHETRSGGALAATPDPAARHTERVSMAEGSLAGWHDATLMTLKMRTRNWVAWARSG